MAKTLDVEIIGAGIIGLSCAWRLVQAGLQVRIVDPSPFPGKTSWAAAGMLAPSFEFLTSKAPDPEFLGFGLWSKGLWTAFSEQLEDISGERLDYQNGPSFAVLDEDQIEAASLTKVKHEIVASADIQGLAADLGGVASLPDDGQVDNRQTLTALKIGLKRLDVDIAPAAIGADYQILCAGWQAANIVPVSGQALSLPRHKDHPDHVIRKGSIYVVPKADRTIIGASSHPGNILGETDEGVIAHLRHEACELCPGLAFGEVQETWVGIRPGTQNGKPILGWTRPGRLVATGHYRNGILLAPGTAELMKRLIFDEPLPGFADTLMTTPATS